MYDQPKLSTPVQLCSLRRPDPQLLQSRLSPGATGPFSCGGPGSSYSVGHAYRSKGATDRLKRDTNLVAIAQADGRICVYQQPSKGSTLNSPVIVAESFLPTGVVPCSNPVIWTDRNDTSMAAKKRYLAVAARKPPGHCAVWIWQHDASKVGERSVTSPSTTEQSSTFSVASEICSMIAVSTRQILALDIQSGIHTLFRNEQGVWNLREAKSSIWAGSAPFHFSSLRLPEIGSEEGRGLATSSRASVLLIKSVTSTSKKQQLLATSTTLSPSSRPPRSQGQNARQADVPAAKEDGELKVCIVTADIVSGEIVIDPEHRLRAAGIDSVMDIKTLDHNGVGGLAILRKDDYICRLSLKISSAGRMVWAEDAEPFRAALDIPAIALLACGAHHGILLGDSQDRSGSSASVRIQTIDLRLSATLASVDVPIPSALRARAKGGVRKDSQYQIHTDAMCLNERAQGGIRTGSVVLLFTCKQPQEEAASVFFLNYATPVRSLLRHAMGTRPAHTTIVDPQASVIGPLLTSSEKDFIATLTDMLSDSSAQIDGAAVDTLVMAWVEKEKERLVRDSAAKNRSSANNRQGNGFRSGPEPDSDGSGISSASRTLQRAPRPVGQKRFHHVSKALRPTFSTQLLCALLPALFGRGPAARGTSPCITHAKRSLRYLLERRMLSESVWRQASTTRLGTGAGQVSESLFNKIFETGDRVAILLALRNIPDLDLPDIITVLADLASSGHHKAGSGTQITLPVYLSALVGISCNRTSLRLELQRTVREASGLERILLVLVEWLESFTPNDASSIAAKSTGHQSSASGYSVDPNGVVITLASQVRAPSQRSRIPMTAVKIPKLALILSFSSDIIDSFYPELLSTSSFATIRRFWAAVEGLLSVTDNLRTLSAPLLPFATLDKKLAVNPADRVLALESRLPGSISTRVLTGGKHGEGAVRTARANAREQGAVAGAHSVEELHL